MYLKKINLSFEMRTYGLKFYLKIWNMTDSANIVCYKWGWVFKSVHYIGLNVSLKKLKSSMMSYNDAL